MLFSVKRVSWMQLFRSLSVGLGRESKGEGKGREGVYHCVLSLRSVDSTPASLTSLLERQSQAQTRTPGPEPACAQDPRVVPLHIDGSKHRPRG